MRSHTGSGTGTPTEAGTGTGSSSGAGYRAVFRVREFRFVFAAHVLSLLGSVVAHVALPVLVYAGTSSALLSAVTFALGFLPQALGGALLARVADRFAARTVLVGCDLLCAACVGAMLLPGMPVAGLLALRAVSAFVQPLFAGVRAAGLGEILEGDAFVLGRSLIRVAAQAAQIAGFAATGLLLLALSPRSALLLTAGGFLASAALLGVGTRTRPPVAVNRVRGGTRVLFADRRVRGLLALSWLPSAFVVVPEGLAPPYADEIGAGSVGVGLLLTAMPVGAVAAELAAGSLLRPVTRERLVLPLAGVLLVPLLLFALRPALPLSLLALALAGTGMAYTLGLDRWLFDAIPEELRARAMTVLSAGLMTVQGMGMAAGGLVAEFVPPHWAVAGSGIVGTGCVLVAVRAVRRAARSQRPPGEGPLSAALSVPSLPRASGP